jgi:hypothetical protein
MAAKTPSSPPRSTPPAAPASSRTTPTDAAEAVSLQPAAIDALSREDAIRARAYFLWEQAGRPAGDGAEFWVRAEQEMQTPD